MRRLWPVAVAAMLMLAGCGDDAPPAEVSATATGAPAPAATGTSGSSAPTGATGGGAPATETGAPGSAGFVSVVRERLPEVALDRRDDEIGAVAERACASVADGQNAEAVVAEARSLGTADAEAADHATARELIKLAIDTVCPDQDRRVDEF